MPGVSGEWEADVKLRDPRIESSACVAPTAAIYGDVTIDARAVVTSGVVLRAECDRIVVGSEANMQDNAVVLVDAGFPCLIGRRVTVGMPLCLTEPG
jgi:carbonic anhydrase/acetyltransferase-like protein (isoleucine patch superfamily)